MGFFCLQKKKQVHETCRFSFLKEVTHTKRALPFGETFVPLLSPVLTVCVFILRPFTIPQVLRPKGQEDGQEDEEEDEEEEEEEEAEKERTKVTFSLWLGLH